MCVLYEKGMENTIYKVPGYDIPLGFGFNGDGGLIRPGHEDSQGNGLRMAFLNMQMILRMALHELLVHLLLTLHYGRDMGSYTPLRG